MPESFHLRSLIRKVKKVAQQQSPEGAGSNEAATSAVSANPVNPGGTVNNVVVPASTPVLTRPINNQGVLIVNIPPLWICLDKSFLDKMERIIQSLQENQRI